MKLRQRLTVADDMAASLRFDAATVQLLHIIAECMVEANEEHAGQIAAQSAAMRAVSFDWLPTIEDVDQTEAGIDPRNQ